MSTLPRIQRVLSIVFFSSIHIYSTGQNLGSSVKQLCDDTSGTAIRITSLSGKAVFSDAVAALQKAGSDGNEYGLMFGRDSSDSVIISKISTSGAINSSPVNIGFPGAFADAHNHPRNTAPSAGDIYNLIKLNKDHPAFDTRFTILANRTIYATVITDKQKADSFVTRYPPEQTPGFSPRFPEQQFNEFADLKSYLINIQNTDRTKADEIATAFMLDKYDSGVSLMLYVEQKRFQQIIVRELIDDRGNKTYRMELCTDN